MKDEKLIHNVHGPVRSLNVEVFECKVQDEQLVENPWYSYTITFNLSGNIIEYVNRNPDGSIWRTINEFSDTGKRIATRIYDPNDQLIGQVHYIYDSDGRLMAERVISKEGEEKTSTTYSYDALGQKIKTGKLNMPEDADVSICIEGTNTSINAQNAENMQTLYNQQDDVVDVKVFDVNGEILSHVEIIRDEWGNPLEDRHHAGNKMPFGTCSSNFCSTEGEVSLTEEQKAEVAAEIARMFPPGTEISKNTYIYDEAGRLIESKLTMMGMIAHHRIFKYDGRGNKCEEQNYNGDGTLEFRAIITHEYDERGNWTKEVISTTRSSDVEAELATPNTVTRRKITYY